MTIKCTYCESEAVSPQHIKPPMCERHHAIVILVSRARRLNLAVTPANLTDLLAQANGRLGIMAADVPQLLGDVQ
ncbi:MAG: hypothetical protein JXR84_08420 [Anaerolineae bacterium]|nr:hypothetical protein [Anaerolineae bacterium]